MTDETTYEASESGDGLGNSLSQARGELGDAQIVVEAFAAQIAISFKDTALVAGQFSAEISKAADEMANLGSVQDQTTKAMLSSIEAMKTSSDEMAASVTASLKSVVLEGENFSDAMRSLFMRLTDTALGAAMKPLENFIGSGIESGLSGLGQIAQSGVGSLFSSLGSLFSPTAFASGGIIGSPTYFPLSEGLGVAGEAGPEAVLPLTRGEDGRLGVASAGARVGRGGAPITVNIQAQDVSSFRRSEGQISAAIARAVRRGQKSL